MTPPTAACPVASIGQQFNPFAQDHLEDPFPFYELARRQEPVFFSPALGMWVVTRYCDARAVVNQPALFSSRNSVKNIAPVCPAAQAVLATGVPPTPTVVDSDPPGHARWRKVIAGGFAASRMRRLEPQIREITNARIDAIAPFRHGDVVADLAFPIPLQVIARLCDIGDEHCDNLRRWSQSLIALVSSVMAPERQVEVAHDMVDFQAFMADQIASKRAQPGDDIISDLLAADGDQPFTENELIIQMMNLFVAGHETTANLIANAVYHLLRQPQRWDQILAEPSLTAAAVEEVLRFDAPVPMFVRTANADTELAGQHIAEGDGVLVVFASANHDDEHFAHPDVFDLHRPNNNTHLAFGYGIHYCVGATLARIEARVVLETMAARLPNLRLVPGQHIGHVPQLVFHALERLEVEWD